MALEHTLCWLSLVGPYVCMFPVQALLVDHVLPVFCGDVDGSASSELP